MAVKVIVTRTNTSGLKEPIELRVRDDCTIEGLKTAIKKKLELGEDAADFLLFYWELCLDDHHSKETKLVDLGHPIDNLLMEYPAAGKLSDIINKPDLVKISSDKPRKIIKPKPGRTAEEFYWNEEIDGNAFNYQLTSCGFMGRELYIFIENSYREKEEGKHLTLAYKIPRKTRKVFVQTTETEPLTDKSKFNLICEVETKDKVFKKDDWTFVNCGDGVVTIPFEDGEVRQFWDKENQHEQRWKKYTLPIMEFAGNMAGAAGDIAGAV